MATQKDKQRLGRLTRLAELLATPMTSHERLEIVRKEMNLPGRQANSALERARKILRKRHEREADAEAFEQVERLRQLAKEARGSRDYQAQIAAERLLADIVGTKKAEKKHVEVSVLSDLVALAGVADRERKE